MRSRAPSEYEKTLEFTTPKRHLFERGWRQRSCRRGIAVSRDVSGSIPFLRYIRRLRRQGQSSVSAARCQAPQFAMVALCRRRGGFLALPCSLGFRLAASPTGRTRLRSFAKGAFWSVRFPAPSECEKTLEFTTPKRPLFERGWHALACRGIAVFQWRKRRRREFPMAAVSAVAKHSLSRFRRQLVSKRSFLDCAPFFF